MTWEVMSLSCTGVITPEWASVAIAIIWTAPKRIRQINEVRSFREIVAYMSDEFLSRVWITDFANGFFPYLPLIANGSGILLSL
jgi:hypothetical protein